MSNPRPRFGNRLPSDQDVTPGRSQSIQERCNADTRTTYSGSGQQSDGEGDRNRDCSEVYHQDPVREASLSTNRGRERRRKRFEPYGSKSRPTQRDSRDLPRRDTESGTVRSKPCNTDSLTTRTDSRDPPRRDTERGTGRSKPYDSKSRPIQRYSRDPPRRDRERGTGRSKPGNTDSLTTRTDSRDSPRRDRERGTGRYKPCNTDSLTTCSDSREPSTRDNTSEGPLKLCDYCGDALKETTKRTDKNKVYHDNCIRVHKPNCHRAIEKFRIIINSDDPILPVGINASFLYGQEKQDKTNKKKKRDIKSVELLNDVSAVFNSGRGYIFIHFVGLAPGDDFTGAFDEFADVKLNGLINDGSAFVDVYKKQLLSKHSNKELQKFNDILVLTVESVEFLVTSDAKTKSTLDDCIIDTPDQTLFKLLRKAPQFEQQHHKLPIEKPDDLRNLQESRDIQAKACCQPTEPLDKLVSYVFDNRKLAKYISAFSKLKSGGSYLLGLAEEEYACRKGEYKSKRLVVKPLVIKDCDQIEAFIKQRLSETVLVCNYSGKELDNKDLIRVVFIPVKGDTKCMITNDYVIHVSARSVSGIVFYEKNGPVAYRAEAGTERRLSVAEWFEAFKKRI